MTKPIEVIQNIVHDFNHYVEPFDINLIDEEFITLNLMEKLDRLFKVLKNNITLSKDFVVYFVNYLIDVKYDEHLKIFYKKNNLTSKEIADKITNKVITKRLDYHCFEDEIKSIQYNPKLAKWDTEWLTDIPEKVFINLLSNNDYTLDRIIGMANINNYRKLKDFKDVLDGFEYLRERKQYENVAYLLRRNFGRTITRGELGNVNEKNEFNITVMDLLRTQEVITHESIHSKYKHVERFDIIDLVYNLKMSKYNSIKIFREEYTYAIEKYVWRKMFYNEEHMIMNHVFLNRRRNNDLCRQIINFLKQNEFKEMKFK